jgi:hypothetical protein
MERARKRGRQGEGEWATGSAVPTKKNDVDARNEKGRVEGRS